MGRTAVRTWPRSRVEVVDPVGAGDAFAAGYLHGLLGGADEMERLACGHRFAAAVLCVVGDIADSARLGRPRRAAPSPAVRAGAHRAPPRSWGTRKERRSHRADI